MQTALLVAMLLAVLFAGACSKETNNGTPKGKPHTGQGETTSSKGPATTGTPPPPEVTLGDDAGGRPEVVIRLEGDPEATFSGLCSVGAEHNVLSGRVPKRFTFDPKGRQLSCRIEKRDGGDGDLRVVLVAGGATRSVQQTNSPGSVINVSYQGS